MQRIAILWLVGANLLGAQDRTLAPQVWLNTNVSQRYDYGLEFLLESEQRLSAEGPLYQRYEFDPQVVWHFSPRYDFCVGYEENRQWDGQSQNWGGHELFAYTTIKLPLNPWLVTSKQRLQGGFDDMGRSSLVFRQQNRLSYENPRLPWHLRPYLQDEWFYDLGNGSGIQENRASIGVAYSINKAWSTELYVMRLDQWDLIGERTTTPVVGFNLSVAF